LNDLPGNAKAALADAPHVRGIVLMTPLLPGGRRRLPFILPSPHPNLILPPGTGLAPGRV
jgi:hypothetical protein